MNALPALVALAAFALVRSRAGSPGSTLSSGDGGGSVDDAGSDYPGAIWIPAASSCWRAGNGRQVRHIVIHITDGAGNARNTAQYFADGAEGRKVSAHYVVGRDGAVYQCVAEADIAFHAHTANATSIGIENSARTAGEWGNGDAGLPVTDDNYRATADLCRFLCHKWRLPADRSTLVGHNEIDAKTTHSDCPTGQWDWDRFMAFVREEA